MKRFTFISLFFALLALSLSSCQPEVIEEPAEQTEEADKQSSKDLALAQSLYDDAYQVMETAMNESGVYKTSSICATVTHDSAAKTVLIDFGTAGCTGIYGRERAGSITIQYIGQDRLPGSEFSATFDDYTIDDYELDGTLVVNNFNRNGSNQVFFTYQVVDGKLTYPGGDESLFSSTRTFTWVAGEGSSDPSAQVLEITGDSQGSNSGGRTYTSTITQPLVIRSACALESRAYPVEGTIKIEINNRPGVFTLDFGAGNCDRIASLQYFNQSVSLPLD